MTKEEKTVCYCRNMAVDAVIHFYAGELKQRGILFECDMMLPANISISDTDLCKIYGNLLENAVNGCIECGSRDEITVNLRMKKGKLVIVCSNPCKTDLVIENDIIKPKGTGIESILMAIDKYDGNIRYQMEDGILTACVILNC